MSDQPVSLKVMRVSRPALSAAWEPFYSTSPSFSAHSSAAVNSLQGAAPLPGHPKTLRDLSQPNEMLSLPAAFGSIFLGETFESCLCVNNDANFGVQRVSLKVEMQTATTKVTLAELGGPECTLAVGGTLEDVVRSEMTELGQHVLACTVSYSPPNQPTESLSFRKFYKFAVTNPLSVKTKIHPVRSPTALLSITEREKLFMQIHVQNLTPDPLWFERISFDCVDGWTAEAADSTISSVFSGASALMLPQDIRQYLYILTPTTTYPVPRNHPPGSVIPLGKMDISWRSSFGEPGRLVTSTLTRRIPLVNPLSQATPAPALPLHLKRTGSLTAAPRPQSPVPRPSTPPVVRPGSPFRASTLPQPQPVAQVPSKVADVNLHLTLRHIAREKIIMNQPFSIDYTLTVVPISGGKRTLSLLVQQYQFTSASSAIVQLPAAVTHPAGSFTPHLSSSGYSTPSPTVQTFNYPVAHQKISSLSKRRESEVPDTPLKESPSNPATILPPQIVRGIEDPATDPHVLLLGPSSFTLPPVTLEGDGVGGQQSSVEREFSLNFLPTKEGFMTIGGLKVLLLEETLPNKLTVLEDWKVIAEVVVRGT